MLPVNDGTTSTSGGAVDGSTPVEPAYFSLAKTSGLQGADRWLLTRKGTGHFIAGINQMNSTFYRAAHATKDQSLEEATWQYTWGAYADESDWLRDQVRHVESWNLNTFGPWVHGHYEFDKVLYNPKKGNYLSLNFWNNLTHYRFFEEHGYPYGLMIHMIPNMALYYSETVDGFQYYPDVFSEDFTDLAILKAYLMLVPEGEAGGGAYGYQYDSDLERPLYDAQQQRLLVPDPWQQHITGGQRDSQMAIGFWLGNDAQWCWDDRPGDHFAKFKWGRKLITCVEDNDHPQTPARQAFAQAMKELYPTVSDWNARYASEGYEISSFTDLATKFSMECGKNNAALELFLTHPGHQCVGCYDLGDVLEMEDREHFMKRVAHQFYEVSTRAIRYFDKHHLIFSDRYMNGGCDLAGKMKATIASVAAEYVDALSFHFYPNTHRGGRSITDELTALGALYERLDTKRPIMLNEFVIQADYELGFDQCLEQHPMWGDPIGIRRPCGVGFKEGACEQGTGYHGPPGSFEFGQLETGCLEDRKRDFEEFTRLTWSAKTEPTDPTGGEHFILGSFWTIYYDVPTSFNQPESRPPNEAVFQGRESNGHRTENWGMVNAWCDTPSNCENGHPYAARYPMVDRVRYINHLVQCEAAGRPWCDETRSGADCSRNYDCATELPQLLGEVDKGPLPVIPSRNEITGSSMCDSEHFIVPACQAKHGSS